MIYVRSDSGRVIDATKDPSPMAKILTLTLSLMLAGATLASADPPSDVKSHCVAQYQGNYSMQLACVRNEVAARNEVSRWSTGDPEIYAYCYQYDSWSMVNACGRNQRSARQQLDRMPSAPSTPAGCVDRGHLRICG
jgi:hypothetical protein